MLDCWSKAGLADRPEPEDVALRTIRLAIAIGLACVAAPALAQDPSQQATPPVPPGRYTFSRVEDGILRLDHVSGQITICSQHTAGWACQAVPEDRAALEAEIARLQDEVGSLKRDIAALKAPPAAAQNDQAKTDDAKKDEAKKDDTRKGDAKVIPQLKLPSNEDIERARSALEDAWRRLVDMIMNFQKDMLRKE